LYISSSAAVNDRLLADAEGKSLLRPFVDETARLFISSNADAPTPSGMARLLIKHVGCTPQVDKICYVNRW
jgi:hypothetical protein